MVCNSYGVDVDCRALAESSDYLGDAPGGFGYFLVGVERAKAEAHRRVKELGGDAHRLQDRRGE